jgi:hypothetical protein
LGNLIAPGKSYPPDTEIEIATLDDVLFLDRRNDVAFVVEGREDMAKNLFKHRGRLQAYLDTLSFTRPCCLLNRHVEARIFQVQLLSVPFPLPFFV